MYLFTFRAIVNPKSKTAFEHSDAGGAYVNCWISFKDRDGAEKLAKFYIKKAGWIPEMKTEESQVQKSWCKKKTDKKYYAEALKYGYTLVLNMWPKTAQDAGYDYESEETNR